MPRGPVQGWHAQSACVFVCARARAQSESAAACFTVIELQCARPDKGEGMFHSKRDTCGDLCRPEHKLSISESANQGVYFEGSGSMQ